jgi:sarcosine oxidase, subunit beta
LDSSRRFAVVGAGAWGLSCALALLEGGATDVQVYERAQPGSGSTALAAGLVSTHLRQPRDIELVLETRRRIYKLREWGRLEGRPSAEHVYQGVGSVTIVPQHEADKLERLRERIRTAGGNAEFVTGAEIARRWPLTGLDQMTGLHTAEDGHVEGGDLVDLLQARVRSLGGRIGGERAAALRVTRGRVEGVASTQGDEAFDEVVVAAGPWSKQVLADAGLAVPIKAYRTQLAQLGFAHAGRFPVLHDSDLRVYARPDGDDAILMGDGTEFVESHPESFARGADHAFIEKIAASCSQRVRGGSAASYRRGWAGLCVGTPDRDPIIGPYPGVGGLHLMVGDNGFGVMRSLALGAVAARSMLKGQPDPTFRPDRVPMTTDFEIREGFEL